MPHQVTRREAGGSNRAPAVVTLALAITLGLGGCETPPAAEATPYAGPAEPSFWPPPPDEPRVQFLRSYRLSTDVERERGAIDRIVFGDDVQALPIAKPYGVEMWRDRLYVCDITNPSVVILDLAARETRLMVTRGVERMVQPIDIAINADGTKYVVDFRLRRIFVFDADDRHFTTFGGGDLVPAGVTVRGDELYVPDFTTQSVLVLDRFDGSRRRAIGGPDAFVRPLGVHVDDAGTLHVSDAIRGRVHEFDAAGNALRVIGGIGDAPGSFVRPKHLSVDADGNLYVVDAAFQNVQMFNRDGELLMFFGGPGQHDGAMSLPAGVTVHEGVGAPLASLVHPSFEPERLVVVTNQFGPHKISIYAVGRLRDGYTTGDLRPAKAKAPVTPSAPGG